MSVSRWERGVQEPSSQIFVKLGTLSSGEMRWQFWEMAGLQRSHVEGSGGNQIIVDDPSDIQHAAIRSSLVPIPLLEARLGAALHGDFLNGCDVVELLTAPAEWCPHPSKTYSAFVEGDSMEPLIRDGSVVCFDTYETSPSALASHIVIAQHPQLGTKISWLDDLGGGNYRFRSENPSEAPMPLDSDWKLIGRLLWWLTRTTATAKATVPE